jgi:DNA polymerase-3 subunit epsilon
MKLIFIDVETTGLDHKKNAIIQLAGIIRIDGRIKDRFNYKMQPHKEATIDVNEQLAMRYRTKQETGFKKFKKLLEKHVNPYNKKDKFYFVAYNSKFDENFLRAWFLRNDDKYFGSYFWNPSLDVMQLALRDVMLKGERHELDNMKLGTVCKHYGIRVKEDDLHDAAYDIKITKDLYNKIVKKQPLKKRKRRK